MEKTMTMTEVLSKLKLAKKLLNDTLNEIYLGNNNVPFNRYNHKYLFIDIINRANGSTVIGLPMDQAEPNIQSNWDRVASQYALVNKLTMIKESVNHTVKLEIPNPDFTKGGTVKLSIAEVLTLINKKGEYDRFLRALKSQYVSATTYMAEYERTVLNDKKANAYVNEKLGQNITLSEEDKPNQYLAYYKEYMENNKVEWVDPLKLKDKIDKLEKWIDDFYTEVDFKLSEVNAKTKILVDLDADENIWSIVDEIRIPIPQD